MSKTYYGCLSCKDTIDRDSAPNTCTCGKIFLDRTGDLIRVSADPRHMVISDKSYWECEHLGETWSWQLVEECSLCLAMAEGKRVERERVLQIIKDYRYKPSFTFNNLISLIKGEQK